ncbi:MAG: CoA-binding protein [Bacteroidota bacterium]|nr:CoA-binding protein [Bacteroidota bacterium]
MLQGIKIAENSSDIKSVLTSSRVIAVVGSSPSPEKDSYMITKYLINKGYKVYPVNPNYQEILGVVWFQFGVGSAEAIKYALENELTVVNDRCIKIEHMQLIG